MGREIDEKVVSMQFDNSKFESNVKTSMTTIEKLKNALNFDGLTKGFSNLTSAANKVNMNGLSSAVETVHAKFSALEVIGITALTNITNTAINAGKRMVKSLSLDQVTAGWSKYEEITGATQTIMAATGKDIEYVEKRLQKLNWFTDETSYNLTDMVSNVGKFTSAGVDLDKAVTAMQGIATEAALSGANAQQASRAMYNFSQALGMGSVKLQDWMSIENANMATKEFKETIIETAKELGYLDKNYELTEKALKNAPSNFKNPGKVTFENFRQTLSAGWFDADLLTAALNKYGSFADKLQQVMATTELDMTSDLLRYVDQYKKGTIDIDAASVQAGISAEKFNAILKDLSSSEYDLGLKAFKAAQEAKTLTDALNATKDAVSTSWMNTFKIIFGNYEEAKVMWTNLANDLWEIFAGPIQEKNAVLADAFNSKWSTLSNTISDVGLSVDDFQKTLNSTAKSHGIDLDKLIKEYGSLEDVLNNGAISSELVREAFTKWTDSAKGASKVTKATADDLKKFQSIVNQVIQGNFGNGEARIKALTKAGWDYKTVQGLVNKQLKNGKITIDDLSDSQLKSIGYTDDQIEALRELGDQALDSDSELSKLLDSINQPSGRDLFIGSLENILHSFMAVIDMVKEAWGEIFDGTSSDEIYNILKSLNDLTTKGLNGLNENADKVKRTLKGLFAIIDLITSVTRAGFKIALKIVANLLGIVDIDVLDITAHMGDLIVRFRDWVKQNSFIAKGINFVVDKIADGIRSIKDYIKAFSELPKVQRTVKTFKDSASNNFKLLTKDVDFSTEGIKNFFRNLKTLLSKFKEIPIIEKISDRIESKFGGTLSKIKDFFADIKDSIDEFIDKLKKIDGFSFDNIKKPIEELRDSISNPVRDSKDSFEGSSIFVKDFKTAFKDNMDKASEAATNFGDAVKEMAKKVKDAFANDLSMGDVAAIGLGIGMIVAVSKLSTAINNLTPPLVTFKQLIGNLSGVFSDLRRFIKMQTIGVTILEIATAVGILTVSLTVLSMIDPKRLWPAVAAVSTLAIVLGGISIIISKLMNSIELGQVTGLLLAFGGAILMIAGSFAIIAKADSDGVKTAGIALAAIATGLFAFTAIIGKMKLDIGNVVKPILAFSAGIYIVALALMKLSKIPYETIEQDITMLALIFIGMTALSKQMRKGLRRKDNNGTAYLGMAAGIYLIVLALKKISKIGPDKVYESMVPILLIFVMYERVLKKTKRAGKHAKSAGVGLLAMSASILVILYAIKQMSKLKEEDIEKAIVPIGALLILFGIVSALTNKSGENAGKAGLAIMEMSVALVIIAGAMHILAKLDPKSLAQTTASMAVLILSLSAAIAATKDSDKAVKTVTALTVCVTILATAIAILSIMKPDRVLPVALVLSAVMLSLGYTFKMISEMNDYSKEAYKTFAFMLIFIAEIGAAIGLISKFGGSTGQIIGAAAGISVVLLALAASMNIIDRVGVVSTDAIDTLRSMCITLGIVGVVLGAVVGLAGGLGGASASQFIGAAVGMAIAIIAVSSALRLVDGVEGMSKDATKSLYAMAGAAAIVGVVIGAVSRFGGSAEQSIAAAIGIAGILIAMTIALNIAGMAKTISKDALIGLGLLELGVVAVGAVLALILSTGASAEQTISAAVGIGVVLISMAAVLAICAVIGPFIDEAAAGILALDLLIADLVIVISAIGTAFESMDGLEDVFDKGLEMLTKLGSGLGTAIGSFINAIGTTIADGLPHIGEKISEFVEKLKPGIDMLNSIDPESVDAAKRFANLILQLTATELIQGLVDLGESVFGTDGMESMSENLQAFGEALVSFSNTVAGNINEDAVSAAANAGMLLASLENSLPRQGGILQEWIGEKSLETFGKDLVPFATALTTAGLVFTTAPVNWDAVDSATASATLLAELNNALPSRDGILQEWIGEKSLETFGKDLKEFAEGLVEAGEAFTNCKVDWTAVDAATASAQLLANLNNSLPSRDGILQDWIGEKSLETFGEDLGDFAEDLTTAAATFAANPVNEDAVKSAVKSAELLAALNKDIPATNGALQWVMGEKDLSGFAEGIEDLGTGLKKFSDSIGTGISAQSVESATNAAEMLVDFISTLDSSGGLIENIGEFFGGDKMETLYDAMDGMEYMGEAIAKFSETTKNVKAEDLETSIDCAVDALEVIEDIIDEDLDSDGEDVKGFKGDMIELGWALHDFYKKATANAKISDIAAAVDAIVDIVESLNGIFSHQLYSPPEDLATMFADLGQAAVNFGSKIEGYTFDQKLIRAACSAIKTIASALQKIPANVDQGLILSDVLEELGPSLVSFATNVSTIDTDKVKAAITGLDDALGDIDNITSFSEKMHNVGSEAMEELADSIITYSPTVITDLETMVKDAIEMLEGYVVQFTNIGTKFAQALQTGYTSVTISFTDSLPSVESSFSSTISKFYTAGANCVYGLNNGLNDNKAVSKVESTIKRLASSANSALKKGFKEKSPSKIWYGIGDYAVLGLVNAFREGVSLVSKNSENLGLTANDSLNEAMLSATALLSDDISYDPVIRPVVDLSDVIASKDEIASLFNNPQAMYLQNGLTLSKTMSRYGYQDPVIYNDSNVTQGITDLRKEVGELKEAMSEFKIVLNTGVVAGAMTRDMDRNLGSLYSHKERGI